MGITLFGPSNPLWLSAAAGVILAAFILTWRVWWLLAQVIVAGFVIAWCAIWRK